MGGPQYQNQGQTSNPHVISQTTSQTNGLLDDEVINVFDLDNAGQTPGITPGVT